jgi:hypothetical protein
VSEPKIVVTEKMSESALKSVENTSKRTGIAYSDIAVVIGYLDKDGNRQESVHVIDSDVVDISKVNLVVENKMRACKNEEGNLIGYEPSGEVHLKLEVKYFES